jgi:hypothetical protein
MSNDMRYVFSGDNKSGEDGILKIAFDILINEEDLINIFQNILTWREDESHELWGFVFFDEFGDSLDGVIVRYLDEEKKYSKRDFIQLLTTAIMRFFRMYPDVEGKEKIDKIIDSSNNAEE